MLGAGARAGDVAARAAHQLRGLPPAAALGLAARETTEVRLVSYMKCYIYIVNIIRLLVIINYKEFKPIYFVCSRYCNNK